MSTWLYVLCGLIAVLGRILSHALGAKRELANRNRQFRLERLVDAWRSIELAANGRGEQANLEAALRDIQLFGTQSQMDRAAGVVRALDRGRDAAPLLLELLEALRGDVRKEMRLSQPATPLAFAFVGAPAAETPRRTPATIATTRRPRSRISALHPHRRSAPVREDDVAA